MDMKLVWSIISAKIGAHVIQVIAIGRTMVYLARALLESFYM